MRLKPSLETILENFESLSLDDRLFFTLRSLDDLEVHLLFQKNPSHWSIWYPLAERESKQSCSTIELPSVLEGFGVEPSNLVDEISGNLLIQAAYAHQFGQQIRELLGDEAVDASITSTQEFMEALKAAVASLSPASPENSEDSDTNKDAASPKRRFRLIHSQD